MTVAALTFLLCMSGAASAQDTSPAHSASQSSAPAPSAPDFYLGRPHGTIGVRGSWMFARAGSDLFDFVQRQLTVDKNDFNAPVFAAEGSLSMSPRIDVAFGIEMSRRSKASEYRDFVDNKLLPISQETSLDQRNVYASVRYSLLPRGTSVSRFAWVPRSVVPYVGAGGGALWYKFSQSGDFVDFVDLSVFTDSFQSSGYTPSAHAFGGADIRLYRALFLTVEGRYTWAAARLGNDFVDFDPIDLAGFKMSTGIHVVF